jgi:hypothetical protein
MLVMVCDVENVLVEFHDTPTASEAECCGRSLREMRSNFGDGVQPLTLMTSRIHPVGFPEQYKIVFCSFIIPAGRMCTQKRCFCNPVLLRGHKKARIIHID